MVGHCATPKMTTPTEVKVYDKDGDLILRVGPTETLYQTCSRSLARKSPVFERMLFGKFAESRPAVGDWVVDLPEDDTRAMGLFLAMVHVQFDRIPRPLPLASLYALLTLTNKYDASAIVRGFGRSWIAPLQNFVQDYRLLGVAWELGDSIVFSKMMRAMIENSVVGSDDQLHFDHGLGPHPFPLEDFVYLRPTRLIEMIEEGRQSLIGVALWTLTTGLNIRTGSSIVYECRYLVQTQSAENHRCCCTILGSLVKILAHEGLSLETICGEDAFRHSPRKFRRILRESKIFALHPECEKSIAKVLWDGAMQMDKVCEEKCERTNVRFW
ncbi:hypothetical protein CGCF415_v013684 [Colletotrichum fructicola]|uniref:Nuclear pore protein-like protein n=1 Tax=Colletotrichum fructicola (strain Nara gc5) TaxID=1213859 RepID=L2FVV2_COLFN|nr:uncharacterized protein CGMCC3_g11741 [Colletotrichum fructicola]KAE9572324.1 hypothetical protein CGMCC3_g11741 [Colletotrichum fructicola]KAF4482100.1 hypothetical protein CGGC5_v010236 [Colletotrichum fructicola Nara gc5]KAF4883425.1 hypothetical protein CGCFRS4_v013599 [Colletotrichum fructicola]KAF4890479.1 hypothetical protein CGCF415_v013684 [Colletotrichum fructicola]